MVTAVVVENAGKPFAVVAPNCEAKIIKGVVFGLHPILFNRCTKCLYGFVRTDNGDRLPEIGASVEVGNLGALCFPAAGIVPEN